MIAVTACGSGNTVAGPSPVEQGPVPRETFLVSCGTDWDGFQCRAVLGFASSNPQDVTGFADWSTSDPSIATVDTVGFVTVRGTGTIAIRANYRGLQAFEALRVEPQIVPLQIRTFWGYVRDAQTGAPLSGVTVQILDGLNADRITATGADGLYRMENMGLSQSRTAFAFRVLFAKPGYAAVERTFIMTRDKFNELSLSLTRISS